MVIRRLLAMLGFALLVAIVIALIYAVHLHREGTPGLRDPEDEVVVSAEHSPRGPNRGGKT